MLRNLTLAVAAMISVASTSALSEQRAKGGERDPRIRTFIYYDDDAVPHQCRHRLYLHGHVRPW